MPHVVIVGAGFAGINAAQKLAKQREVSITVIDQRNHHLFQPLLYQVAMAGLDPSDIATPIRTMMRSFRNVRTLLGRVDAVDLEGKWIESDAGRLPFDYLIVACGASHQYFGNERWEPFAPGLKTLGQATEIRRRVLNAFEQAERSEDPEEQACWLTFVIVGGGPTGVELAGAIAEMARFTLCDDFRRIKPADARVILVEGRPRILEQFEADQAAYATTALQKLGVQVRTDCQATEVDAEGIAIGEERITARTVLWAAGVKASPLGQQLKTPLDHVGRVRVAPDLSLPDHPHVFVAGDLAHVADPAGNPLPGIAPVAIQQGRYLGKRIAEEIRAGQQGQGQQGRTGERPPFRYHDKGQMATIGRKRAILQSGRWKQNGFIAWAAWLIIHLYYLSSFRNRLFVFLSWCWSYLTFFKGARLIVPKEWRSYEELVDDTPVDVGQAELASGKLKR